jgi:hypothetical protein
MANFTGTLGNVQFTNGTSTYDLSPESMAGVAAIYACDTASSGGTDSGSLEDTTAAGFVESDVGDTDQAAIVGTVVGNGQSVGSNSETSESADSTGNVIDGVGGTTSN